MRAVCLLSCLLPFVGTAFDACGEEIIIESSASGKNNDQYSEPEGKWIDSRTPPASAKSSAPGLSPRGECGSRKILFWRSSGAVTTAPASARFTPRLFARGKYSVYATWTSAANAAPVHYVVRHAGGESLVRIRQDGRGAAGSANADRWVALGEYLFAPDAGHYVELRLELETGPVTRKAFGQIVADAVKFTTEAPSADAEEVATVPGGLPAVAAPAPAPSAPLDWSKNLEEAQTLARQTGRKIFVFFHLPGNETWREYEERLFSDSVVRAVLSTGFVPVRLDIARDARLATALGAYRAGTINLYDSRGNAIGQISDRVEPAELVARLRNL